MKKIIGSRSFVFAACLAMAVQGFACNDSDAGPEAPAELEQTDQQAQALELPCTAYLQGQNINAGNWTVCGTRPFGAYTYFRFTNPAGSDMLVRMQSGPDLAYVTVPASGELVWAHKYYGGFVRIEPVSSSVTVSIW